MRKCGPGWEKAAADVFKQPTWQDSFIRPDSELQHLPKEITLRSRKCGTETWTTTGKPQICSTTSQMQAMRSGIYKLDSSRRKYLGRQPKLSRKWKSLVS
ncbi:hypothetical protein J3459_013660 [Metarhizium acridum]|nr:hypothetical protein J3459_013660 [Metarhizium acridum]